jgi:hypothetical protein
VSLEYRKYLGAIYFEIERGAEPEGSRSSSTSMAAT